MEEEKYHFYRYIKDDYVEGVSDISRKYKYDGLPFTLNRETIESMEMDYLGYITRTEVIEKYIKKS